MITKKTYLLLLLNWQTMHLSYKVSIPKELVALMSALHDGDFPDPNDCKKQIYRFKQNVPIPSYLLALVVGALEGRKIGPRTTVWTEKELLEALVYEFAEAGDRSLASVNTFGPSNVLTNLVRNLHEVDVDAAFSSVPYEKGFAFLFYLEQLLGGPDVFLGFLKTYIQMLAYKSVTTDEWKFLYSDFTDNAGEYI